MGRTIVYFTLPAIAGTLYTVDAVRVRLNIEQRGLIENIDGVNMKNASLT